MNAREAYEKATKEPTEFLGNLIEERVSKGYLGCLIEDDYISKKDIKWLLDNGYKVEENDYNTIISWDVT